MKSNEDTYKVVTPKMTKGVKALLLRGLTRGGFDDSDKQTLIEFLNIPTIHVEVVEAKEEIQRLEELRKELGIEDNA